MEENSRTKNSIFNIVSNFLIYFVKLILGFVSRTIFIRTLGETYLGVNGLFSNILSMLSLADLGIGIAISFSLYKPIKDKDNKKISILMSFYKKAYNIIGLVILTFGMLLFPFLHKIIKNYNEIANIDIIYILYLINTVSTYFTAYKETLIIADQKSYKLTKINIVSTIMLYISQSIVLILTCNFIIYLVTQFGIQLIQKIVTNIYVTKQYPNVHYNEKEKLDTETSKKIKKNVKGMIYHKMGDYCINGTDNIIISSFIDINTVGFYSNYTTLISMLNNIITMIFTSMTASFGNLIVTSRERLLKVFKKIDFISFCMYSYFGICIIGVINKFIKIWIGEKYLLSNFTVWLIGFNFFFTGIRIVIGIVKQVAGENDKDRFVPIIQSSINIVISIIGVKLCGLDGVIIGTIASSLAPNIIRPIIVYKYVFKKSSKEYFKNFIKHVITFILGSIIIELINNFININNDILSLLVSLICTLIYVIMIILIYGKTEEYREMINSIKEIINKRRKNSDEI